MLSAHLEDSVLVLKTDNITTVFVNSLKGLNIRKKCLINLYTRKVYIVLWFHICKNQGPLT